MNVYCRELKNITKELKNITKELRNIVSILERAYPLEESHKESHKESPKDDRPTIWKVSTPGYENSSVSVVTYHYQKPPVPIGSMLTELKASKGLDYWIVVSDKTYRMYMKREDLPNWFSLSDVMVSKRTT